MPYHNKISLLGNLTADPELRFLPGKDTPVCKFTLAMNKPKNKKDKERVIFIDVAVFGEYGKTVHVYLKKGAQVLISGELEYSAWESAGEKLSKHSVKADDVQFMNIPETQKMETEQ